MKTIQEMTQEAGAEEVAADNGDYFEGCTAFSDKELEAFATLVREEAIAEASAKANASWTLMCEKMVSIERDACAKVCLDWMEPFSGFNDYCKGGIDGLVKAAKAIRARSNT